MRTLQDIFEIWPSTSAMAKDLNEKYDTVKRWGLRGRIPVTVWPKLIEKAARKEHLVTAAELLRLNKPTPRMQRETHVA